MKQSGGKTVLPSEYFFKNSGRYTPENNVGMGVDSAYGPTFPTSRGTIIGKNMMGPDLGVYPNPNQQTGGSYYNKIINPMTGRRVGIKSTLGKRILQKYIDNL